MGRILVHGRDALIASINRFEGTLRQSAGRSDSDFEEHRKDAIELRRQIAAHRTEITGLIEEAIDSLELRNAFRSKFLALCSALALHQASWPIVTIDLKNREYQASREATREKYRAFFEWARSALGSG
jgi:hypothetical protein